MGLIIHPPMLFRLPYSRSGHQSLPLSILLNTSKSLPILKAPLGHLPLRCLLHGHTMDEGIRQAESQLIEVQQFMALSKDFMTSTQLFMEETRRDQAETKKLIEEQSRKTDDRFNEIAEMLRSLMPKNPTPNASEKGKSSNIAAPTQEVTGRCSSGSLEVDSRSSFLMQKLNLSFHEEIEDSLTKVDEDRQILYVSSMEYSSPSKTKEDLSKIGTINTSTHEIVLGRFVEVEQESFLDAYHLFDEMPMRAGSDKLQGDCSVDLTKDLASRNLVSRYEISYHIEKFWKNTGIELIVEVQQYRVVEMPHLGSRHELNLVFDPAIRVYLCG